MEQSRLKAILLEFRTGQKTLAQTLSKLKHFSFEDLGFAKIDHHRQLRKGFAEVIFCENKTSLQVIPILKSLMKQGRTVLATRVSAALAKDVQKAIKGLEYHAEARALVKRPEKSRPQGLVMVITGGTSDIPVAEEAALTAEVMGNRVSRCYDVGGAGIHRLLAHKEEWEKARALVVVAGMDGVLPTLLAGLTDKPIVAVPTSVGYGASFQGIAPLLTMLNSCAAGVAVMNIDNGFGAGYFASLINQKIS